ncbi:MAG: Octaprenyl-diphosphate synthase [Alphaproteobacteria bacterium MarineAlpha6_Bin2]|nr:MAG: Octaprenyl-diphosphate synthase [Alphaproteobacteria bacterium MarineAlpha6_Bin2]
MVLLYKYDLQNNLNNQKKLDDLQQLVNSDLKNVNIIIKDKIKNKINHIPKVAGHLVKAGGKRIRPMLCLACAQLCDYKGVKHLNLAASIEFIHTATLLHDDVIDESKKRRGLRTANNIWGNKSSVLVGDFLLSKSFELMTEVKNIEVLQILSETSSIIIEGEMSQMLSNRNITTTEDDYLDIIKSKTAQLFATASKICSYLTKVPSQYKNALNSFGMNLGMAFQLIDDLLDYKAIEKDLGKKVGDDFKEGKITLPIILALRRSDYIEKKFWKKTVQDGQINPGDFEKACSILKKREILYDIQKRAKHYSAIAKDALGIFQHSKEKKILLNIIDFIVDRNF